MGVCFPDIRAAALRYRAQRQKLQLRAFHAAPHAAGSAAIPRVAAGTVWTPLGPAPLASDATGLGVQDYGPVAGRVTAVAVDPADGSGNTVYIGGAYGGVWKSSNAGALSPNPSSVTWTPLTDDQPTLAVGSIAIQPQLTSPDAHRSVVLVGTGETNSSADSYYGLGILRSADAGAHLDPDFAGQHRHSIFCRPRLQPDRIQHREPQPGGRRGRRSDAGRDRGPRGSSHGQSRTLLLQRRRTVVELCHREGCRSDY